MLGTKEHLKQASLIHALFELCKELFMILVFRLQSCLHK